MPPMVQGLAEVMVDWHHNRELQWAFATLHAELTAQLASVANASRMNSSDIMLMTVRPESEISRVTFSWDIDDALLPEWVESTTAGFQAVFNRSVNMLRGLGKEDSQVAGCISLPPPVKQPDAHHYLCAFGQWHWRRRWTSSGGHSAKVQIGVISFVLDKSWHWSWPFKRVDHPDLAKCLENAEALAGRNYLKADKEKLLTMGTTTTGSPAK